jgi:hypothetical protein
MRLRCVSIVAITLASLSLAAQVHPGASPMYVIDAAGRVVGLVTPMASLFGSPSVGEIVGVVRLEVDGIGSVFMRLERLPSGIHWRSAPVYFVSSDCTGDAYAHRESSIGDRIALVGTDQGLYVGAPDNGGTVGRIFHSATYTDVDGAVKCSGFATNEMLPGLPLSRVARIDDFFVRPFTLTTATKTRAVRSAEH